MTPYLSSLTAATTVLTLFIAFIVAWIAYQQYRTANAKLNLDLFDKRLAVYQQVRDAVAVINSKGRPDEAADRNLLEAIGASEFLFGEDIRSYLEGMWQRFCRLRAAKEEPKTDQATRERHAQAASDLILEITEFYYDGADRFAHYMRMDHRLRRPVKRIRQRPRAAGK